MYIYIHIYIYARVNVSMQFSSKYHAGIAVNLQILSRIAKLTFMGWQRYCS